MNCVDLFVVMFAVGFGFYFGKDFYSTFIELIFRACDKDEPHRPMMCFLVGLLWVILVCMFISVEIPIVNPFPVNAP